MVYMQDNSNNGFIFTTKHPKYRSDCKKLTVKEGKAALKEQCINKLKTILKPGSTVSTSSTNVVDSDSEIHVCFTIDDLTDGSIVNIDYYASIILNKSRANNGALIVKKCEKDVGFKLTNQLGSVLWPTVTSGHAFKHLSF
jgi:hypothetical protein